MPIATPRSTPRCSIAPRPVGSPYPRSTSRPRRPVNAAPGLRTPSRDGIIQFSWGGAGFASGQSIKDMVTGAVALARVHHVVAEKLPINIAAHRPLPAAEARRVRRPLVDISRAGGQRAVAALPVPHVGRFGHSAGGEPRHRRGDARQNCNRANIIMELEIGVVGGERTASRPKHDAKLYSTPEDGLATAAKLGLGRAQPVHSGGDLR